VEVLLEAIDVDDESLGLAKTVGLELALAETVAPLDGGASEVSAPPVGERFELGREIGRGGMGRILEANDRQFRRTVAIKEMLPGGGAQARRRFLTEALVTGNLEHPGIPAVYERGDHADGSSYYAMQLVTGRTLAEALEVASSLEERLRLLPAVVKVAETVAYAHERGVVHRDLKPENVIVGRHGQVFLLDWGIAKVRGVPTSDGGSITGAVDAGAKTQVGALMGSPMYMAPEQARGDTAAIDERTDVFALGAMLYHVLAGRAPYQGNTVLALAAKALEARPPPVSELVADVNPELVAICTKAMQREAGDRHRSALELAAALETFQSQAAQAKPSRAIQGAQTAGLGAVLLMTALMLAVGLGGAVYAMAVFGGAISGLALFATVVGLTLAVVEYRTRGRQKLVGVGLGVAAITLCLGVVMLLKGVQNTVGELQTPEFAQDVPAFLHHAAEGLAEATYGPFTAMSLALAQVVIWALVSRHSALAEATPRARPSRATGTNG
jgi:hypothetical protein